MPYLNIDDGMDEHPKIEALSDAAFRLHVSAMLYCARRGTDGVVALAKARRLTESASDGVAMELVQAGVWHDLGTGCRDSKNCLPGAKNAYVIHDYLQWNHSANWWAERRRKDAERQAEWRAKKGLSPKKNRKASA